MDSDTEMNTFDDDGWLLSLGELDLWEYELREYGRVLSDEEREALGRG